MAFVLYEIWAIDENGHEVFVETVGNLVEAKRIAQQVINNDAYEAVIYEPSDDDAFEVERFKKS